MAKTMTTAQIYGCRLIVLLFAMVAYFHIPGLEEFLDAGINHLRQRNFEGLRQFILGYGLWAPFVSIALMMLQSLIPVVPGLVITITNAWIFGWQYGALYSWTGGLLGALLDFGLARWYGRLPVEKFVKTNYLTMIDVFIKKYGIGAIFITRLTPIIPFKIVSYGAGLTRMSPWRFAVATAIGQAPAIILYSILGQNITHHLRTTMVLTSLFITLGVVAYYYRAAIKRRFFPDEE